MSLNKTIRKHIKKLDETVVNRISAGEVIHRPVHVVKELMENRSLFINILIFFLINELQNIENN